MPEPSNSNAPSSSPADVADSGAGTSLPPEPRTPSISTAPGNEAATEPSPPVGVARREQRQARELRRGRAAARAVTAAGAGTEATGAGIQAAGKTVNAAGKGMSAAGRATTQGGAALSRTGVGAIAGVPLAAAGAVGSASGAGMQATGKGMDATGKGVRMSGKRLRRATGAAGGLAMPPGSGGQSGMSNAAKLEQQRRTGAHSKLTHGNAMVDRVSKMASNIPGAGGAVAEAAAGELLDRFGHIVFWGPLASMWGIYFLTAPIILPITGGYLILGLLGIPKFRSTLMKWFVWIVSAAIGGGIWLAALLLLILVLDYVTSIMDNPIIRSLFYFFPNLFG